MDARQFIKSLNEEQRQFYTAYTKEQESKVDEMVRLAKDEVLDDLLEWQELWQGTHKEPFNWYGAVKALKVAKERKKPFIQLSTNKKGGER